jgi:hypothetical protein
MLPLPSLENKTEDVIFRINFNATNHEVQMYNRLWVSTRALQLFGVDPTSQQAVGIWLQDIYQAYYKIRNDLFGQETEVTPDKLKALIETYCHELKRNACIQDHWVTIYHNNQKQLDSRQLKL